MGGWEGLAPNTQNCDAPLARPSLVWAVCGSPSGGSLSGPDSLRDTPTSPSPSHPPPRGMPDPPWSSGVADPPPPTPPFGSGLRERLAGLAGETQQARSPGTEPPQMGRSNVQPYRIPDISTLEVGHRSSYWEHRGSRERGDCSLKPRWENRPASRGRNGVRFALGTRSRKRPQPGREA